MSQVKKILSNVWIVSIFSSIIGTLIISAFTALFKQINFFVALQLILKWIIRVITFRIPIYIIALIIILFIIAIKIYIKIDDLKTSNSPKWLNYIKASYKDWFMKWEYQMGYDNKYTIENLRPICQCGCELSYKQQYKNVFYGGGVLVCPKCENTYRPIDTAFLEDFHKILINDINTGNYPQDIKA